MAKKYPTSADFSQRSIVQVHKTASDVIDTFGGDFGNYDSEALSGFGDSDSLFQRQHKYKDFCDDRYQDENEDEDDYQEVSNPVNVPSDTHEIVKETAKNKVEADLKSQGANQETISQAKKIIDAIPAAQLHQVVADAATTKAQAKTYIHPMLGLMQTNSIKMGSLPSGFGDLFSDIRDLVVSKVETAAPAAVQQVATAAVQAAAAPVVKALTAASQTPQAQAALQQASNTALASAQKAISDKMNAIWSQYKLPVMIGAGSLAALAIFFIVRKRK